ncbi:MAG: GNAT family N-acetyltransferase [Proteobacteria bacterium]|nr:GNAT family N-acetyltransferase [Pseudomonadota bacterium]
MSKLSYEFRQTTCDTPSLSAYAGLLSEVFGNGGLWTVPSLQWLYRDNPMGSVVGFDAFLDNQLAAHYVTVPVAARSGSKKLKGLLSLNTATHPQHTGKGLFTKLAEQTYTRAAEQGFAFVIGVANQNSTPGFTRKLGFELVAPLEARIGITHRPAQLNRDQYEFVLLKSEEFLKWRLAKPGRQYRLARMGQRHLVYAPSGYPGIDVLMTSNDQSATLPDLPLGRPLLKLSLGIDTLASSKGLSIDIPMFLRPSPLNLIFKSLHTDTKSIIGAKLLFETIDFDAY